MVGEEYGCGGGALRLEWEKEPKNEHSEEHGKSLVPMPRICCSKTHTHMHTHSVESLQGAQSKGEGSDKNYQCSSALESKAFPVAYKVTSYKVA